MSHLQTRARSTIGALVAMCACTTTAAPAAAVTATPACAKPGATVAVQASGFSSNAQSGRLVLQADVVKGDQSSEADQQMPLPQQPLQSSDPSTGTATMFFSMPSARSFGPDPLFAWNVNVEQYIGGTPEFFGQTGSVALDVPTIAMSTSLRAGNRIPVNTIAFAYGFHSAHVFVHLISPRRKQLRSVSLEASKTDELACGFAHKVVDFRGATRGTWTVVANTSSKSTSAVGGASTKVKLTG